MRAGPHTPNPAQEPEHSPAQKDKSLARLLDEAASAAIRQEIKHTPARSNLYEYVRLSDLDEATVVGFDGHERTVTLRFEVMPGAAIGDKWLVRFGEQLGEQ